MAAMALLGLQVLERFYCEIAIMKKLDHPGQCLSTLLEETIFAVLTTLKTNNVSLKINGWKMKFLLKSSLLRGHVNFRGGILVLVTTRV